MSGMTLDDDVEAIGLYFLFGHDRWATAGNNMDTRPSKPGSRPLSLVDRSTVMICSSRFLLA
jgi:hypothetical protein